MRFSILKLIAIFLLSFCLIDLQLMVMRALSVVRYHHFSYLVISTALMGFGVSGTFLTFFYPRMKKHFGKWMPVFYGGFLVTIPISYLAAQSLPLDVQYVLFSGYQQLLLISYNMLIFIPFFMGAVALGMNLTYFRDKASLFYGFDLLGSGAGGVVALGMMYLFPAVLLPLKLTAVVLIGLFCWLLSSPSYYFKQARIFTATILLIAGIFTVVSLYYEAHFNVDQYKELANFQNLEDQGDATHLSTTNGPRGRIDVFQSETFHHTLFAGLNTTSLPPDQTALLIDGETAGTVFHIDSSSEAAIMDNTPQSLAYRLTDQPKVLLLGEVGGPNIWLAERWDAEQITVVQTNPQLIELMKGPLAGISGHIFAKENVRIINQEPRLFLEQSEQTFDIIQFVGAEGTSSGGSGLQSLHENYLLTTEAISTALEKLSATGLLTLTRGIQSPPRDNLKISAMFIEAIRQANKNHPGDYLLAGRNYLAMNTLLAKQPLTQARIDSFQGICQDLIMDADYYPGMDPSEKRMTNQVEGPDSTTSWYTHGIEQMLSGNGNKFMDDWIYNIEPPSDHQPYFFNFFKWSSLQKFFNVYGQHWLQRLELGYVVLVITLVQVTLVAFILILLPLLLVKRSAFVQSANKLPVFLHFGAIGIGFMFLEMVYIQQFTKFMGDPIYSTAAALTSILVFAGIGSFSQYIIRWRPEKRIVVSGIIVITIALFYLVTLDRLLDQFIDWPTQGRFLVTVFLLMPPSYFMGWLFPSGLAILASKDSPLTPWAWGVNGFVSVAAAPLAVLLSMSFGFGLVVILAALFYLTSVGTVKLWR